jgi:hypothetical protein
MKKNNLNRTTSLFYFSGNIDVILFLLQKELRGVKVSQLCTPLGINSDFFYPNLGILILSLMDLPYRSESFMAWYDQKLQKWSARVDLENKSATSELTLDFYHYLKRNFKKSFSD